METSVNKNITHRHQGAITSPLSAAMYSDFGKASERDYPSLNSKHCASCHPGNMVVKIYTLGRFSAVINEQPVELAKKPLTLLKVLIARSGRDVPEEDIAAVVWPDSDGDVALQNFATTLHRLRKLFRTPDAISSKNGRVSINAGICYVDIWAFQRLVSLADSIKTGNIESSRKIEILENAVQLYRGAFLEADSEGLAGVSRLRERLRSKFARCIEDLSEYYEHKGLYKQALHIYERSLEIDDAIEELYRGLMIRYFRQRQSSGLYAVYQRYKKVRQATTGLAPNLEMQDHYERLINDHSLRVNTDARVESGPSD